MTLQQQVEELGTLQAELAPVRPKLEREKQLKEAIKAAHAHEPGDRSFGIESENYVAAVGEMANERSISNKPKLIKLLSASVFRQIATVTFKALEAHLSKLELSTVTVWARTGTRTLTVVPKTLVSKSE